MNKIIGCPCGTKLQVNVQPETATVMCPKCKRMLQVRGDAALGSTAAPQTKSATANSAASAAKNEFVVVRCACGKPLKVARSAVGTSVRCPHCGQISEFSKAGKQPASKPTPPVAAVSRPAPVQAQRPVARTQAPAAKPPAPVARPQQPVARTPPALDLSTFDSVDLGSLPPPSFGGQLPNAKTPKRRAATATPPSGSMPTVVVQWSLIVMFACAVLLTLLSFGTTLTAQYMAKQARASSSERPSSREEAQVRFDAAVKRAETNKMILKVLYYGTFASYIGLLVASLAAVVGFVLSLANSSGGLMASLVVTAIFLLAFVVVDAVKRTGVMFTYNPFELSSHTSVPATMRHAVSVALNWGGEANRALIWTAASIELLLGGFLVSFGMGSIVRRRRFRNQSLALSIVLVVSSALYCLTMLGLTVSLSNLDFFDKGNLHSVVALALIIALPVLMLLAMLIAIEDAKRKPA